MRVEPEGVVPWAKWCIFFTKGGQGRRVGEPRQPGSSVTMQERWSDSDTIGSGSRLTVVSLRSLIP